MSNNKISTKKVNRIANKIKRYLYYDKKITPKLCIKNTHAFELFVKDQQLEVKGNIKKFIVKLSDSKENEVLNRRAIRKPRKKTGSPRAMYLNYLQSEEWQQKREEVFLERGRKCERCEKDLTNKMADVHHKTYKNLFNEKLEDLEVLCRPCHQEEHRNDKRRKTEVKKSPVKKKELSFKQKCKMLETEKGRQRLKSMGYNFTKKVA